MTKDEVEYHGYKISWAGPTYNELETVVQYNFAVQKNNKTIFRLSFKASEEYLDEYLPAQNISASEKEDFVRTKGLNRLCAILDLGKFKEGERQEYMLTTDVLNRKSQETLSDTEIRHEILKGFYNIFKNCPEGEAYKTENSNAEGVCELLNIDKNSYDRNLNWLITMGYLKREVHQYSDPQYPSLGLPTSSTFIYITDKGLGLVESEEKAGTVVESIFRDTRKFVDAELMQICPEVFKKLTETYKDLEAGQSRLKWSQVAFACRDILQDFTEAIYDKYVPPGEIRPRREQTANKIRLVVESATNSKTERIFIPALAEYLSQYFEGLNELIQKHTHGSPDIEKEDANRCLIYTYLLIRDVLKIIKG